MVDLSPFQERLNAAFKSMPPSCHDPRGEFVRLLSGHGFKSPSMPIVGRIDRIGGPEDKGHKKNGWYIYHEMKSERDGEVIGIGHFGCWKTGMSEMWCSRSSNFMTVSERADFNAKREIIRAEQEAERIELNREACKKSYTIWKDSPIAESHEYMAKKNIIKNENVKLANDGRLIIPIWVNESLMVSLQFIAADGQKRFLTGGRTKGCYHLIKGSTDKIYVCEGYADAMSIHMATGSSVYAAFSSHNLFEVAQMAVKSHGVNVVIAGDDDTETAGNPGRTKAQQAADGLGIAVVFPAGYKDFNDMMVGSGIESLTGYLNPKTKKYAAPEIAANNEQSVPNGFLSDVVSYYMATSGNKQHGFAIQTALGLASIVLARSYTTNYENYSSLFLLNVGKSGTGKEHSKTVIERILNSAGMGQLIAGDGYTSAGAVFSALLDRPRHISIIDEFGRYLEAGRNMAKGNQHQREANTKLMESIGRCQSIMRAPTYSSMTLKKDAAEALKNRFVYNPAITLLTMTTPDTLFKSLDMGAIKDGFVNRFIISISDAERTIRKHKPPIETPESILTWIAAVLERHGKQHISAEPASPIILEFSNEAFDAQIDFQIYCNDLANKLEKFGMAELTGRSNEMALRLSMIVALSRDPMAETISKEDMEWAISYIKTMLEKTVNVLKITISGSEFEGWKKEILADLRARGADGITWSAMQKNAPYSKHKPKDLKEILAALDHADLASSEPYTAATGGRPTVRWFATMS